MSPHQQQCPMAGDRVVLDPAFKADAPGQYAHLRALGPVHRVEYHQGLPGWLVVGHDLAREALTHPALLKDSAPAAEQLAAAGFLLNQPGVGLIDHMLDADPPEHARLRRLVAGAFTPRRTAELAPRVEQIAHDLLDALPPAGEADLVEAFNAPLPVTVIAELLGVPQEHRATSAAGRPTPCRSPRRNTAPPCSACTHCCATSSGASGAPPGTICCPRWSWPTTTRTAGSPRTNWSARPCC